MFPFDDVIMFTETIRGGVFQILTADILQVTHKGELLAVFCGFKAGHIVSSNCT